ncbi:hypothetical protein AKJ63_01520 [candidate division MSBL1 archaeon SCGC-AAA259D18]|uniref:Transporter n=2 Tax=candidate division MSBL1 TaxID=215777 RepID=A0A133U9T1_9EURY|nr:hypothetical protein AKJ57_03040 [candidate division MSBL1 archaeon SCGC-AAA259A05]KXA91408.1 hypothetical protein AKJ63_01520 [candidate division MSBL1 archaeon SCGC-AAA259D18]
MFGEVILSILLLLAAGLVSREVGLLDSFRIKLLNKFAFYVALPALIFHSIYGRSLEEIFSPTLVSGFCLVILLTLGIGWLSYGNFKDDAKKSVAITQSYHGNLGYMGLPIVIMGFGKAAGAKASLLVGVGSASQIALTTILLVHLNGVRTTLKSKLEKIVANPVLLSLVAGLCFSFLRISIPSQPERILSLLSETALPIALLGVGASIKLRRRKGDLRLLGSVIGLKMILMPVLGWVLLHLLEVGSLGLKTGVLMLGMPTAVSTFIYTKELGGDEELASKNISFTTIFSIPTITVLLFLLS